MASKHLSRLVQESVFIEAAWGGGKMRYSDYVAFVNFGVQRHEILTCSQQVTK